MISKQFGGKITSADLQRYQNSPHWINGSFKNLTYTETAVNWRQLPDILCKQIKGHKDGNPQTFLPIRRFDIDKFLEPSSDYKFIWFGHSVLLLRIQGVTIAIDPMFGPDASPIGPKRTKRFSPHTLDIIQRLPQIDLMVITHDHYDHMDYESLKLLVGKVDSAFVALGAKRHLTSWGYTETVIEEFDWWESKIFKDISITFTPTRHFSGRGLGSIAKCLWGGWAFKTVQNNIWFSGDGGYGRHFKEVGERLGPFDLAFMECGQYCDDWAQIHLFPEESVQAAIDARAKVAMPVHWAGFNLSYQHAWYDPVEDFCVFAKQAKLTYLTPEMGQLITPQSETKDWWLDYK